MIAITATCSSRPLAGSATDSYVYAGNDPINQTDPLGLFLLPFVLPSAPGVSGNNPRPTWKGWLSNNDPKDAEFHRNLALEVTKLAVEAMPQRSNAYLDDWFGRSASREKVRLGWVKMGSAFANAKLNPGQGLVRSDANGKKKLECIPRPGDPNAHLGSKRAFAFVDAGTASPVGLYICDAFWDLANIPVSGWARTVEGAIATTIVGTMVHEFSHFSDTIATLDTLRNKKGVGGPGAHRALALEGYWEPNLKLSRPSADEFYKEAASWEYHLQSQLAEPGPIDRHRDLLRPRR
jgi:hypothetical protein